VSTPTVPELAPAFDVVVHLGGVDDYGVTRAGHRRIIPILGGAITGEVEATILPGGADWQLVRTDGALEIDGRYSARTADGSLLYLQVSGVRSGPPEVLARRCWPGWMSRRTGTTSAPRCASRRRHPSWRRSSMRCSSRPASATPRRCATPPTG
jgi:hypothetical protein